MYAEWDNLCEDAQLALSNKALGYAMRVAAQQAEGLADEIERGALADHGGPDALRLLAILIRSAEGAARRDPSRR